MTTTSANSCAVWPAGVTYLILINHRYPYTLNSHFQVMDANQDKSEMRAVYDEHRSKILFGHV